MSGDFVLIDDASGQGFALLFERPREWIVAHEPEHVDAALASLDRAIAGGAHVAGAFSYELGYLFEPRLTPLLPARRPAPLISVGVFSAPRILESQEIESFLENFGSAGRVAGVSPAWDFATYASAFARVQEYIEAGDTYQINLAFPLEIEVDGDPLALYRDLRAASRAAHGALLRLGGALVLSLSPELFFARDGGRLHARPMKGTAKRWLDPRHDEAALRALRADEKQRAENLMIVDLLRNDLSRLASRGSVRVDDLFSVATYPTLHAMTSGVSASVPEETGLSEILRALFPCGSVTGAPKIRAMEIIRELEPAPRGFYCGAIGHMGPRGGAFNVAIRTLVAQGSRAVLNVGSGLVYDSEPRGEYDECLLKARFLAFPSFGLIETMRLEDGNYFLLERHLARLASSAAHFGFAHDEASARALLSRTAEGLGAGLHRVRLELLMTGQMRFQTGKLVPWREPVKLALSPHRVDSRDAHLRHKTTRRALYDSEYERLAREQGADEVLFLNELGGIADGSRSTIFIERGGILYTPPLVSGALDGVLRRELIENGERKITERALTQDDVISAAAIYVGNALRGLMRAKLIESGWAGLPIEAAEISMARFR